MAPLAAPIPGALSDELAPVRPTALPDPMPRPPLASSQAEPAALAELPPIPSFAPMKAASLYRFLAYVEFPQGLLPSPTAPLVIGVLGADDVYEALASVLRGRAIKNRPVQRKRLTDEGSLAGVHLLFTGPEVDLTHHPLVTAALGSPVLLVSDTPLGLSHGAVFNFVQQNDRLRFEASLDAAAKARLRLSSRLLAVAERVQGTR